MWAMQPKSASVILLACFEHHLFFDSIPLMDHFFLT
jgi:hypothetical protein